MARAGEYPFPERPLYFGVCNTFGVRYERSEYCSSATDAEAGEVHEQSLESLDGKTRDDSTFTYCTIP